MKITRGLKVSKVILEQSIWFSPTASKHLRSLKPIFEKLRLVHRDYNAAELYDDCSFWYSERPHIGFLAAAVWLHGDTALEEFRTKRQRRLGRRDLSFRIRGARFDCEAKHRRVNLRNAAEASRKVREGLEQASRAVRDRTAEEAADKLLALCFVSPEIQASRSPELNDRLREWIRSVRDNRQCQAVVWIGFRKGKTPTITGAERRLYPGSLIAISELK